MENLRIDEAVKSVLSIAPQTIAAGTTNGNLGGSSGWIDTEGFDEASLKWIFGAVADTVVDIDLKCYESDVPSGTGTEIEAVRIADLSGAGSGAIDNSMRLQPVRLGGRATRKRYLRPRIVTGPEGNTVVSCVVQLGRPRTVPVQQTVAPTFD